LGITNSSLPISSCVYKMKDNLPPTAKNQEFLARFVQLASELRESCEDIESDETTATLLKTKWVEIALAYYRREQKPLRIEVEISASDQDFDPEHRHRLPKIMICHMNYLLDLMRIGFELRILDDCYWLAFKSFEELPQHELIESIIPPNVDSLFIGKSC
jgi:hypothetical protein